MILYPAIDIRGGHAVRLVQGDYDRETAFDADPRDAAMRWVEQGARALHVVDLDGARSGHPQNLGQIRRICAAVEIPVQLGGGLRNPGAVARALEAGAQRVVLGTAALTSPEMVEALAREHRDKIVVAVDARGGHIAVEGWRYSSTSSVRDLIVEMGGRGADSFLYTPVEVDGTLGGPALDGLRSAAAAVSETGGRVIYSGGVGSLEHLRELAGLGLPALAGVIVGRALYERRFTVAEAQAALDAPQPSDQA